MGDTVWVLKEGQDEDNWDHSLILSEEKALNRLSKKLKIKKLSDFYDYSVLNEEFDGPDTEPNFVKPIDVKKSLQALINAIQEGDSGIKSPSGIVEELEDCLKKVTEAEKENCNVRLSIIP
ncbi:MAG: hypothetical protein GY795_39395 [Desulfobacterales bacterium]|nr:hypothetical protein [Desulfobacterales bacterium]